MTPEELILSAEEDPVTEEDLLAFQELLDQYEKQFEKEQRSETPDTHWYLRKYTI